MNEFKDKLQERFKDRKKKSYFRWSNFFIKLILLLLVLMFIHDFISNNSTGVFDFFLNDSKEIQEIIK